MKHVEYIIQDIRDDGKVAVVRRLEAETSLVENWFEGSWFILKCSLALLIFWTPIFAMFTGDILWMIAGGIAVILGPFQSSVWSYEYKLGKAYIEDYPEEETLLDEELQEFLREHIVTGEEKDDKDDKQSTK